MELDPEQIETAHDAALRAARQRQPPQPTHAVEAERQRSLASTLRLIGHSATDPDVVTPLSDSASGNAADPDDSEQGLLGGRAAAMPLPMAPSALFDSAAPGSPAPTVSASASDAPTLAASAIPESFATGGDFDFDALSTDVAAELPPSAVDSEGSPLDSLAVPPGWDAPSSPASGSPASSFFEPDNSTALEPDDSSGSASSPPTSIESTSGEAVIPSSAADVDWSDPSIGSALQSPIPAPSAEDSPLSEPGDKLHADRSEVGSQPAAGRGAGSAMNDEPTGTDGAAPSNTAAVGDSSDEPALLTVTVSLDDREELVAQATQEVAALAEAAAQSTAGQMIDERISELSTLECLRSSQREAAGGF